MIIGIDPGSHSGIAIAQDRKLIQLFESDFWGVIDIIDQYEKALFVVEKPDTKHVWHNHAKTRGAIQKTGVNVGSVIREAELIIAYMVKKNREHLIQRPQGKLNSDQFKRMTGWQGRSNQHQRDAAMLIFNLKIKRSNNECSFV